MLFSFELHCLLLVRGMEFDLIYSAVQLEIFDIVKNSGWRTCKHAGLPLSGLSTYVLSVVLSSNYSIFRHNG